MKSVAIDKLENRLETLKGILMDLGIPQEELHPETLLHEHLGLDSVETVKLALEVKRKLNIDLKLGTRNDMTLAEICSIAATNSPSG